LSVKSIENLDIVNLTNCDSEPIHIPGSIQPHGFLLAVDEAYCIQYCSANIAETGLDPAVILNQHLSALLDGECDTLIPYLDGRMFESAQPHVCMLRDRRYNITAHISGRYLILELELFSDKNLSLPNFYIQTKKFTDILKQAVGLQQLCQSITDEIKNITGYDRVMVYKFDAHYNGEVYAESKNPELESFFGLHYPHTDIPVQARELYLRNLMRLIVDINYKPVPILTRDSNASNQNLDLSHSVLRSVSPIHIEYLRNMGVSGTLTISLILEGKLWGLIACHHYAEKNLAHNIRLSALMQGHFLTSQIRVQEVAENYQLRVRLEKNFERFLEIIDTDHLRTNDNIVGEELADLAGAHGVCLVAEGHVHTYGDVPNNDEVLQLVEKLSENRAEFVVSENIYRDFPVRLSNDIAGLIFYRMDETNSIFWFRNELKKEIKWAGEPEKAIIKNEKGLSPRKSFDVWKETISNFSQPWTDAELTLTAQCAYAIQKHLSFIHSKKMEKAQNDLLKKLMAANEELENINWISTHDLKEPLRKIMVFASLLLDSGKYQFDREPFGLIGKMSAAANKMQNLLDDLFAFSKVKNGQYAFELTNLNKVLQEIMVDNEELIDQQRVKIISDTLPEIYCIPVLIKQLFSNLIINSVKFARAGIPPEIQIRCARTNPGEENAFYEIVLTDNGKGFDNKYAQLIFQLFQRLDKTMTTEGTGIGLAICKKIADIHKGSITAAGKVDSGATFRIVLPYNPAVIQEA
jgi:two-component system, chemotaxis family, sensor kinase Cph1